jgi:TrmH family RNA methyltransferase
MPPRDAITSPSNPHIRAMARLRSAGARRETGLAIVDGRREIERAAKAGVEIVELFVAADEADRPAEAWIAEIASRGATVTHLAERVLDRIAFGERNEGAVAVVRWRGTLLAETARSTGGAFFRADAPLLVVEGVEKPGNLGAIIRTADAAGLAGVIAAGGQTDVANPACIRASLGTVFSVPVAEATTTEAIAWCAAARRHVVAATPTGSRAWHEGRLAGPAAIVLGSEAHGLSQAWNDAAASGEIDLETIRLPMLGLADSLNVSATAAVLAYESLRQQARR